MLIEIQLIDLFGLFTVSERRVDDSALQPGAMDVVAGFVHFVDYSIQPGRHVGADQLSIDIE